MPPDADDCLIVGAGLVGALQAIYLARRGIHSRVLERRPDPRIAEGPAGRSINLALAERGIHSLKNAGVFSRIEPLLLPMRGRMIHDDAGQVSFQPYGQRPGEVIHSVSRGDLNRELLKSAEETGMVRFSFRQNCLSVNIPGKSLKVRDEISGKTETFKYKKLIISDGSGSRLRQQLAREGKLSQEVSKLGHSYKEFLMPAASCGHAMAADALHIWPRKDFMMIGLPNPGGTFTMTLFLSTTGRPGFHELSSQESLENFFKESFPDLLPLIPDYQEQFFGNPTGSLATVRCFPWNHGDALLTGDAAHAIVPFHGQGMNCGFEDCLVLDRCLSGARSFASALENYGKLRKPDCDAIATMALENYVEMRSSVREGDYLLKKEVAFLLEQAFPERFIPRYSMVMFHRTPYREALDRGEIQKEILTQLCRGLDSFGQADMDLAEKLIREKLPPFSDPENQNFAGQSFS